MTPKPNGWRSVRRWKPWRPNWPASLPGADFQGEFLLGQVIPFVFQVGEGQWPVVQPALREFHHQPVLVTMEDKFGRLFQVPRVLNQYGHSQQHAQVAQARFVCRLYAFEYRGGELAPMAAHQRRQVFLELLGKPGQVRITQQVSAVLVVLTVGNGQANLVQPAGPAQYILIRRRVQTPLIRHLLPGGDSGLLHGSTVHLVYVVAFLQGGDGALPNIFVLDAANDVV